MSEIIRRHNDDGDTHLFDGHDLIAKIHLVLRLVFEGLAALIAVCVGMGLFWWARRLSFLDQSDDVLSTYHINDPFKERLHAYLAGICFLTAAAFSIFAYFHMLSPRWSVLAAIGTFGYIGLTVIFYQKRNEDPVANSWD